jgi:hypothetical protein
MKTYPRTQAEKSAFFADLKAKSTPAPSEGPILMSVMETPETTAKARIQTKLDEMNARDAAKSNL